MIARILENLEDPEASASDCLQYLKQLHDIRAIQEIFSALINGGMKSRFNKTKRVNNATSVQVMNQVLFEFIKKFTKSLYQVPRMFAWPTILLGEEIYHPFREKNRHAVKLETLGLQVMSMSASLRSNFVFGEEISSANLSVVNGKGDVVALSRDQRTFKVFKHSGKSRILCEAPTAQRRVSECYLEAMDIDAKDNLYVIIKLESTPDNATDENKSCNLKLFIFDENGNKKLESLLPLDVTKFENVSMAVHKDGFKIAIILDSQLLGSILYIGNVNVELNSVIFDKRVSRVDISGSVHTVQFLSSDGTLVLATLKTVYIYGENGELQRKIEEPIEHKGAIWSVTMNHATKRILFYTKRPSGFSLLSFTETGELQDSLFLGVRDKMRFARLSSQPNGPVALVCDREATLLQL